MSATMAPAGRQDQPEVLAHLGDVLELAHREESTWPAMAAELRASGVLLNEATPGTAPAGADQQPSPDGAPEGEPSDQQPGGGPESFTDFDLDSLPPEARAAAEAAERRMQADYTRKTQAAAEQIREAQQYQAIVQALEDPERAPEILEILGYDLEAEQPQALAGDDDIFGPDPNVRIDQLEQQLFEQSQAEQQRQQQAQLIQLEEQEDEQIAEQIESLEAEVGNEFSKEEIGLIYLLADENRDENGVPNVKGAVDLLEGIIAGRQQSWIQSKTIGGRRLRPGTPASRQVDLSKETPEERHQRMAAAAEAARASQV